MAKASIYIACFGAAHWDFIGKARAGFSGPDQPGAVSRRSGGVAANVAMELAAQRVPVELLTIVGDDADGRGLLSAFENAGVGTSLTLITNSLPTGRYIAVEDAAGELVSAIADCRVLETLPAGAFDTQAVSNAAYWFIETNLPLAVIADLAHRPGRPALIANPVSPARAEGLRPLLPQIGILYCNRVEAEVLCGTRFTASADAAEALLGKGVARAVVTDGPGSVCDAAVTGIFSAQPDRSGFTSATGAGDAFLSRHLAAVIGGADQRTALRVALENGRRSQGRETV